MEKKIFEPVNFNRLKLKNRLVRSATWESLCAFDGSFSESLVEIYRELASGGIGCIITGFTSVSADDNYIGGMMRLSDDGLLPLFSRLTAVIHEHKTAVIAQLALGGFYRNGVETEPDRMTENDIQTVVNQFVASAVRAEKSGFDGVQIHAAHFFFLSRFISPAVNHRTDRWGGSVENRSRILVEILTGIRKAAPSLHISVKINASDFVSSGLDEKQSLQICKLLAINGIDSIEVSGNGTSVSGIRAHKNEGYFVNFAAELSKTIDVPVMVVGGLRSLEKMQQILDETKIELLSLSRPLIREPDLPNRLQSGQSEAACVSCNACYRTIGHRCIFKIRQK